MRLFDVLDDWIVRIATGILRCVLAIGTALVYLQFIAIVGVIAAAILAVLYFVGKKFIFGA